MSAEKRKKGQLTHAWKRAKERYGMTQAEAVATNRQVVAFIQKGESDTCVFLSRSSRRVTLWAVKIKDNWIPVVYDKSTKVVVTFLPEEALQPYRRKLNRKDNKFCEEGDNRAEGSFEDMAGSVGNH